MFIFFFKVKPVSLVSELLPANIPQILINRERLLHKTFDIELLGNCDVIVNELCVRLAQFEPSYGQIKHLTNQSNLTEVLYENVCSSESTNQPKKKFKTSSSNDDQEKNEASKCSTLTSLKDVQFETSYVHHPPRRYIFTGAEINSSSDDSSSSSSDDDEDDELLRKNKSEE